MCQIYFLNNQIKFIRLNDNEAQQGCHQKLKNILNIFYLSKVRIINQVFFFIEKINKTKYLEGNIALNLSNY